MFGRWRCRWCGQWNRRRRHPLACLICRKPRGTKPA